MLCWVKGAGSVGIAPVPDGGARFKAGPDGASGTDAGGTGGGRSENIWAELEAGSSETSAKASTSAGQGHPPRPNPPIPLPPEVMGMLFTENAANSSRSSEVRARRWRNPHQHHMFRRRSLSSHIPRLSHVRRGINHACGLQWMI